MPTRNLFIAAGLILFLAFTLQSAQRAVPASVFEQANADIEQGRLADAESILRSALKAYPQDAHALGMLGVVLDAEKKYKGAAVYYAEALRLDPRSALLLNNLGNHDLAVGDVSDARQAYLKVVAIEPHSANANLQLARISLEQKQGGEALRYLYALPDSIRQSPTVEILQAEALHAAGREREAESLLKKVADAGGGDPRVAFSAGMTKVKWKDYKGAEQLLKQALRTDPANFEILYNLGLSALNAGDLKTARQTLEAAIAQQPNDVDTLYNLAWLDSRSGENEKAIERLVRAHQLAPKRMDVTLLMGQVSENLGFYGDAAEAFKEYLKQKPKDELIRREYGFALAHTPEINEAVAVLRSYMKRHPKDARGFYELGVAESVHEQKRAAEDLKRAILLDPKLTAANYALADVLYQQAYYRQAAGILKPLVQQDSANYRALALLGEAELQMNERQQAVAYLARAAQLAPNNRKILLQYGQALERAHQHEKALAVLQKFQQLPPAAPRPYSGLVDYLSMSRQKQQAQYLQHLQGKMRLNPQDISLKVLWAKGLLAQGKISGSLQMFDEILAQRPKEAVLKDCGLTLLAHAQYAEARRFFAQAVAEDPSQPENLLDLSVAIFHAAGAKAALAELDRTPSSSRRGDYYLLRAQILDALGQAQEAASNLTLGLRADPTRADLYFEAALFLLKHNQTNELQALLRQAAEKFPDSRQLLLTQAITYGLTRQFEKSNQVMQRIEGRWPQWGEAYLIHGIILVGQAKMKDAEPLLETAIALGARDPFAYYNLALCDMEIFPADTAGAAKAIQTALKLDANDPYTQSLAGKIAFTQKDYPAALEHLQTAIRLWPDMIEAHQTLGATFRAVGDRQKSAAELEEIVRIKQRLRSPDQSPPSDLRGLLFSVPAPAPQGSS